MSNRRTHTNHTPSFPEKARSKNEGGNYGGPRRSDSETKPETPKVSPVQQAFAVEQPWQHRTGARTSASDVRANGTSRTESGWAK